MEKIHLTKYISQSGICSRRDAEDLILNGEVKINSDVVKNPHCYVDSKKQKIFVKGKLIKPIQDIKLFAFHKPKGCITSKDDPLGRQTVYDIIKNNYKNDLNHRLIYIGRLDFNSEGLLLFTNFGELARFFELPKNKIKRVYEVKIFGKWRDEISEILKKGVIIDKIKYSPIKTKILKQNEKQIWIECELYEGKNNELRKIFKHFGFLVSHLKRTQYENFSITGLEKGELREIPKKIVEKILLKSGICSLDNNF